MQISPEANPLALSNAIQLGQQQRIAGPDPAPVDKKDPPSSTKENQEKPLEDPSSEESVALKKLQARDREVHAHEQAHLSAAGQYAKGGASFTYQRGPDGKSYAVGGEVRLDTTPIADNPEATLLKAETIRRAALAPATPSGQDRSVAAQAGKMALEARTEIQKQRTEEQSQPQDLEQRLKQSGALDSEAQSDPVQQLDAFI